MRFGRSELGDKHTKPVTNATHSVWETPAAESLEFQAVESQGVYGWGRGRAKGTVNFSGVGTAEGRASERVYEDMMRFEWIFKN